MKKTDTAILVIDMVNDFVLPGAVLHVAGALETVPAIARFIEFGRQKEWAIIYCNRAHRSSGIDAEVSRRHFFEQGMSFCVPHTHGWQTIKELQPEAGDFMVFKQRYSAFMATDLDLLLRSLGVTRIYITGTQYPNCIRSTAVDAFSLNYETFVCTDCCSANTEEVAEANIFDMKNMGINCVETEKIMSQ